MQKKTLLLLLVLVALLGAGVWYARDVEIRLEEPLIEGFEKNEVVSIRIDNLERNLNLRLQRGADGRFELVDPIEAAADDAIVDFLLEIFESDRAVEVPGDPDPRALGLDPPRLVLTVRERDGSEHELEIGAVDIAKDKVNVRTRGKILRAPRRLDNTLLRDLHDWRRPYAFGVRPDQVVEVHRLGEDPGFADHRFGFELHALLENDGWRLVSPFSAALNPGPAGLFVNAGARFRIEGFLPGKDLDPGLFGLIPPTLTFELVDHATRTWSLEVGARRDRFFACRVAPDGELFQARERDVAGLTIPIELLLDRRLARVPSELIDEVRIVSDEELVLTRDGESFLVGAEGGTVAADDRLVAQFLERLQNVLFYDFLEVGHVAADDARAEVRFLGAGEQWDLVFGEDFVDDEGTPCVRVQRRGDEIVACLKREDLDFLETRAGDLRDHQLCRIDELDVAWLELSGGGVTKRYRRDDKGRWRREGEEGEAFEILKWLDGIFHLRAERFVEPGAGSGEPLEVVVETRDGGRTSFTLLAGDGDTTVARIGGEAALVRVDALHHELWRVLRK